MQAPHDQWKAKWNVHLAKKGTVSIGACSECWFPSGRRGVARVYLLPVGSRIRSSPRASGVCTTRSSRTPLMMGMHTAPCQGLPLSNTHTSGHTSQTQLSCRPRHSSVLQASHSSYDCGATSQSFYLFSRHRLSGTNQMAQTPNLGRTSHRPPPT